MIHDTLRQLHARIQAAEHVPEATRQELTSLLGSLQHEVEELAKTKAEHAESISGFAQVSAREAVRREPDAEALQHSVSGLSASVRRFEVSHPQLTQTVDALCQLLSNMGI